MIDKARQRQQPAQRVDVVDLVEVGTTTEYFIDRLWLCKFRAADPPPAGESGH